MVASMSDKLKSTWNSASPAPTVTTGTRSAGAGTLACQSLNWPTDTAVDFATFAKNPDGSVNQASVQEFTGIVSGNNLTSVVLTSGGSDQGNNIGDTVVMKPTSKGHQDFIEVLQGFFNQDGTVKSKIVALGKVNGGSTDGVLLTDASGNVTVGPITNAKLSTTAGELGGAWTSWTPTFNLVGGGSWGNGVLTGGYIKVGKRVRFWAKFVLGTTTNFAGLTAITLNLPVTAASSYPTPSTIGQVFMTNYYQGFTVMTTTTLASVYVGLASGVYISPADITPTIPLAWANTNFAVVTGDYEAA